MTHSPVSPVGLSGNRLLASLPDANARLLAPHLGAVAFDRRYCFGKAHEPIEHVYFIELGLASINAGHGGGKQVETGLIGPEGMTGVPVVLRDDRSAFHTYAETAGRALRIEAAALREALDASPSLHTTLLRYANALMVQVAHTALANGRCTIEQRLARWLLMAADRVEGGTLTLTHELLALMLGVRRAGVTTALHELESRGLVRVQRGRVAVADRHGLEALAGGAYGPAEAVYRRLIG
ncbi:MAG: Crp/Fnr family transcriptional regulator [Alphaproteobacteria bacterium]|nr:Crp/Fnr family transcriptional regulator [Alphaproteobacteria bacterium]